LLAASGFLSVFNLLGNRNSQLGTSETDDGSSFQGHRDSAPIVMILIPHSR
jgi:hypothetical protein